MNFHLETLRGTWVPPIYTEADLEFYFPLVRMEKDPHQTNGVNDDRIFIMKWMNLRKYQAQTGLPTDVMYSMWRKKLERAVALTGVFRIWSSLQGKGFIGFIRVPHENEENIPTLVMRTVMSNIHGPQTRRGGRKRKASRRSIKKLKL